jgi:uncharacterized protein YoxC
MDSTELIKIVIEVAIGLIAFFAVHTMNAIRKSIDDTRRSVDALNVKVAHIIEKTTWHEKTIEVHDERIRILEKRGGDQ